MRQKKAKKLNKEAAAVWIDYLESREGVEKHWSSFNQFRRAYKENKVKIGEILTGKGFGSTRKPELPVVYYAGQRNNRRRHSRLPNFLR